MFTYDWGKLCKLSGGNVNRILFLFQIALRKHWGHTPVNKQDPMYKYYYHDFRGNSFLINPTPLLNNQWKSKEIAEYIGLASFRNYGDYKARRTKTLDLVSCPMKIENISTNRLLHIEDEKVHFLYEDYTGDKK